MVSRSARTVTLVLVWPTLLGDVSDNQQSIEYSNTKPSAANKNIPTSESWQTDDARTIRKPPLSFSVQMSQILNEMEMDIELMKSRSTKPNADQTKSLVKTSL